MLSLSKTLLITLLFSLCASAYAEQVIKEAEIEKKLTDTATKIEQSKDIDSNLSDLKSLHKDLKTFADKIHPDNFSDNAKVFSKLNALETYLGLLFAEEFKEDKTCEEKRRRIVWSFSPQNPTPKKVNVPAEALKTLELLGKACKRPEYSKF